MKKSILALLLLSSSFVGLSQPEHGFLDINQVDALISATGNHFWDFSKAHFYLPADSLTQPVYTSTLWIGGLDNNDELHLAAERLKQYGSDFFPGPVGNSTSYNPPYNGDWNQVWKVNKTDLEVWLKQVNGSTPASALNWPAHGDVNLGQAYHLAPFVDVDGDGQYNTDNLDYPAMKGDQTLFFLYNDASSAHTETGGEAMGIEVRGMAYAFDCSEDSVLNQTIFLEHTIYNMSDEDYRNVYIANWTDFDLGQPTDDYIGCDPTRNLFFAYNGDEFDQTASGNHGYGSNLPAMGVRLLETPLIEADGIDNPFSLNDSLSLNGIGFGDGIIDNEQLGLAYHAHHQSAVAPFGTPIVAQDYYHYLRGRWKNGEPFTYGGNGFNPLDSNAVRARYMYPDSSDIHNIGTNGIAMEEPWSETTASNSVGDRRAMGSVGPFNLPAGEHVKFSYAYVFGQAKNDNLLAVDVMKANSDHIDSIFRSGTTPCGDFEVTFAVGVEDALPHVINIFPNPASSHIQINGLSTPSTIQISDSKGRKVMDQLLKSPASNQIDISALSNGFYHVEIDLGHSTAHKELIVLK